MKILQVISYLYPAWSYGGPGKLVYDISKRLAMMGNEVTIYSTDAFDMNRRRRSEDNFIFETAKIKALFFKNFNNSLAYNYKLFTPFTSLLNLKKNIQTFDIIHFHEFFTFLTIFGSGFANKTNVPYVISAHGTLDSFHFNHRKNIKTIFMILLGKNILDKAKKLVAATSDEVLEYQKLAQYRRKVVQINNGINIGEFAKLPTKGLFRKKFAIHKNNKIILYLGRINKLKGLEILVTAFAKLKKSINNCVLIIAGSDDSYLDNLKSNIGKLQLGQSVIFPGITYGSEKLKMYADADVFVYPSPAEGFSIAILEAAACGLSLVITYGCKFPEVRKYNAGLITGADEESLYQGLSKIITDDNFRKYAGINARNLVRKNYDIKLMANRLQSLYLDVVNKNE